MFHINQNTCIHASIHAIYICTAGTAHTGEAPTLLSCSYRCFVTSKSTPMSSCTAQLAGLFCFRESPLLYYGTLLSYCWI